MYLDFYHLKEIPFNLDPEPRFIFANPGGKQILAKISDSIGQNKRILAILGQHGSGKTTIIKSLTEQLSSKFQVKTILTPSKNSFEFVEDIYNLFNTQNKDDSKDDLFSKHHNHINYILKHGKKTIFLLDDAHLLSQGIFDLIRLFLKNDLRIILAGQYDLEAKLKDTKYGNLWSEIKDKVVLKNLSYEETKYYINYRLSIFRGNSNFENPFSEEAIRLIDQFSSGLPRRINIICNNALVMGVLKLENCISEKIIEKVKNDKVCFHEIKKILQKVHG